MMFPSSSSQPLQGVGHGLRPVAQGAVGGLTTSADHTWSLLGETSPDFPQRAHSLILDSCMERGVCFPLLVVGLDS